MIKYDAESIQNRIFKKLMDEGASYGWNVVASNSVVSSLIKAESEAVAESLRYAENLFLESKWDTAHNYSSIMAMANLIGYRPRRRQSATGEIRIGRDTSMSSVSGMKKIPKGTVVLCGNQKFVVSKSVILSNGSAYVDASIIQGEVKEVSLAASTYTSLGGYSRSNQFYYIPVVISNVEDSRTDTARQFLQVFVGSTEYDIVDSLDLLDEIGTQVEFVGDYYNSSMFYLKFNANSSRGKTFNAKSSTLPITIKYLASDGSNGNLSSTNQLFMVKLPESSETLYGTNLNPISGGTDEETVANIKALAPKDYLRTFGVSTQEAYENTIVGLSFTVDDDSSGTVVSKTLQPTQTKVYGGTYLKQNLSGNSTTMPCTYVSFLAPGLEDYISRGSEKIESLKNQIDRSLYRYLSQMKSPQDVLKFEIPNYVPFAVKVGINSEKSTSSTIDLETQVAEKIKSYWTEGSDISKVGFTSNFTPSELAVDLHNEFSTNKEEVFSLEELEALHKIVWANALHVKPTESTAFPQYTLRVPFKFSDVFIGSRAKGFKGHKTRDSYELRLDTILNVPDSLKSILESSTGNPNSTVLVKADMDTSLSYDCFYSILGEDLWKNTPSSTEEGDYTQLKDAITKGAKQSSFQIPYQQRILTDNDFEAVETSIDSEDATISKLTKASAAYYNSLCIYCSGNKESSEGHIYDGWLEFDFDSLCNLLVSVGQIKALDMLPGLKCGTPSSGDFSKFKDMLTRYVDVYVGMRPDDQNLKVSASYVESSPVLYIDVEDNGETLANECKASRMIDVISN